jgi:hypothetical protein
VAPSEERKTDFLEERIASRKDWGAYVEIASSLRRSSSSQIDALLADLRARIADAMRRRSGGSA